MISEMDIYIEMGEREREREKDLLCSFLLQK